MSCCQPSASRLKRARSIRGARASAAPPAPCAEMSSACRTSKQHRLIPVVRVRKLLLEEPMLDGSKGYRTVTKPCSAWMAGCVGHRRQLGDRLLLKQLLRSEPKPA